VGLRVEQHPWSSINANLMGTTTVLECARLSGLQRVVFSSSKMAYGPVMEKHQHPIYEPVPEEHPLQPLKLYGKLKRICEEVAGHYGNSRQGCKSNGVKVPYRQLPDSDG
jgi:UDP-glucose 4-epimerase